MRKSFLLLLLLFSLSVFSQNIKSVKIKTLDGKQSVLYDPSIEENMGLNFIQIYKGYEELPLKVVVEVYGNNLPEEVVVKTSIDKGTKYVHDLLDRLMRTAKEKGFMDPTIRELISILPKASTDPFLINGSETPELSTFLYNDLHAKKVFSTDAVSVYSTDYFPVKYEQIANLIFQMRSQDGSIKNLPLYYEPTIHKRNIYVLNVVVSPEESRTLKILTANPYQLGDVVKTKEEATSFRVVNRGRWKYLYASGKTSAQESDVFEQEVFPVKVESTQEMGYLKVKPLNDNSVKQEILDAVKKVNANTVWLMPINENSPLRMSPDLKNARIVRIGDRNYIVSLMAKHPETREELYHKGLFYQHETTGYSVSEYLGGNSAATDFVKYFNDLGIRVMLEEHPDKVSSLGLSYNSLSTEAELLIKRILYIAGYEVAPEDSKRPFDILTTKLRNISNGTEIYSYQFFALKYAYEGRDIDPELPDYVRKEDRVPTNPKDMPSKISEIYVPAVGIPNSDWTTFAQLKMNNTFVELIELVARLDYYKKMFGERKGLYLAGIREDAVHFGILRYDQRSQFVRYINILKQFFPGIIISGEVIAHGTEIAWIGMPLDIIQPPTLIHRDNAFFADDYGRTNQGQAEWDMVVYKLKEYGKAYFSSLTSYDTCPAVTKFPFNEYAMLETCELPYSNHFDAFTKETYVYFPPTAINSMCVGEECGTINDYKNFKADQFGYYQLPHEQGNIDQTRVDLVSTYPLVDWLKKFLQENKYGYKYKMLDPGVSPGGHLSASVYSSDKGLVLILRNNSTLSYPVDHYFGQEIVSAFDKRKILDENLYVIYNLFEFDNKKEGASYYKPEDNMLFEPYDISKNGNLRLRRDIKPYEVLLLTTLTTQELEDIKAEYDYSETGVRKDVPTNPVVKTEPVVSVRRPLDASEFKSSISFYTSDYSEDLKVQIDKLMQRYADIGILESDKVFLFGVDENTSGIYDYVAALVRSGEQDVDLQAFLIMVGALCAGSGHEVFSERTVALAISDAYSMLGIFDTGLELKMDDPRMSIVQELLCKKPMLLERFNNGIKDIRRAR